jgi:hypothetical protein
VRSHSVILAAAIIFRAAAKNLTELRGGRRFNCGTASNACGRTGDSSGRAPSDRTAGDSHTEDRIAESCCGVGLHAGEHVLVDGHREGWAAVAEAFADDFHGDAGLQENRGVGVP